LPVYNVIANEAAISSKN